MRSPRYFATLPALADGAMPEFTAVDAGGRMIASPGGNVTTVTPTLDTAIYAADDLLFNPTSVGAAVPFNAGACMLESVLVLDEADQGVAMDLIFLDASTSLGTLNAAFAASDTLARGIIGIVPILAADYVDFGDFRIAQKANIGMALRAGSGVTNVHMAAVTRGGTPTYAASSLRFKIGFSYL